MKTYESEPNRKVGSSHQLRVASSASASPPLATHSMLALQRVAGNAAVVTMLDRSRARPDRTLGRPNVSVMRMLQPLSWKDLTGNRDPLKPAGGGFMTERIMTFRFQRPNMAATTTASVAAIGDNIGGGVFKHCIPYNRIYTSIENLLSNTTRNQIVLWLNAIILPLGIIDRSRLIPGANRASFDSWVTWIVEEICDWHQNIYQWPYSTGDHAGTAVDNPTMPPAGVMAIPAGVTAANLATLSARLTTAKTALNRATGVAMV